MSAVARIAGGAEQDFPQSRELIEMLPKPEVSLQRGKESFFDLGQGRITADGLPSEREAGPDHRFLPHHLPGNIVITAAGGDAAAGHLAGVVKDDCLSGSRAEINADMDPQCTHGFAPAR